MFQAFFFISKSFDQFGIHTFYYYKVLKNGKTKGIEELKYCRKDV